MHSWYQENTSYDRAAVHCPTCGQPFVHISRVRIARTDEGGYKIDKDILVERGDIRISEGGQSNHRSGFTALTFWCESEECPEFIVTFGEHKGNVFVETSIFGDE